MESDSRHTSNFSCGGESSRMDRPLDQFTAQPRMQPTGGVTEGANALDLTSAIAHELRRSNTQPGWLPWNQQQADGSQSSHEADNGLQLPYGSFLSHHHHQQLIPHYIPRFDEGMGPAMQQMPTLFDYTPELESLASAGQGFYSSSDNGLPALHPVQQVLDPARVDCLRSCASWIERMMQPEVRPTPSHSLSVSTSLRLAERALGTVSCVASQTLDPQSCHSSGMQERSEKSMRSSFTYDPQHDSTMELSAELCTDDDDLEARPTDEKRKKRMLSNRASAQRSRQRRQERLDQLEVLTAQLRVENSTLQKRLSAAMQVAKKFEDQNKNLLKKVDRLSKEVEGSKKTINLIPPLDECASSQHSICASSCEMVGGLQSVDHNDMREGASTPSMSAVRPLGGISAEDDREVKIVSNGNVGKISPVRKSFSACRLGKKRTFGQSEGSATFGECQSTSTGDHIGSRSVGYMTSLPSRPRPPSPPTGIGGATRFLEPRPFSHEVCIPLGLDSSFKDDSNVDCLEADRWLEFADCFM